MKSGFKARVERVGTQSIAVIKEDGVREDGMRERKTQTCIRAGTARWQ